MGNTHSQGADVIITVACFQMFQKSRDFLAVVVNMANAKGARLHPWSGNQDPTGCMVVQKKKKKRLKTKFQKRGEKREWGREGWARGRTGRSSGHRPDVPWRHGTYEIFSKF